MFIQRLVDQRLYIVEMFEQLSHDREVPIRDTHQVSQSTRAKVLREGMNKRHCLLLLGFQLSRMFPRL